MVQRPYGRRSSVALARWLAVCVLCTSWVGGAARLARAQDAVDGEPVDPAIAEPVDPAIAEPSEPVAPSETVASESAEASTRDLRVAVLLLPTGDVDPATTDALTELLIAAVAARGSPQIVGKEEMEALLHRDDAGMLECMASVTCLGVAGVELGVREIVSGTLGRRDGAWIFVLERVDVRSGDVSGRVFRVVEGELGMLIEALSDAVPELYVDAVRPGRIVLHASVGGGVVTLDGETIGVTETGVPFRRELVSPGVHQLELRAPGHEPWRREVDVEEGASLVMDAVLVPAEHHFEVPPWTWVFGAAAVLSLGGGIALGVLSSGDAREGATMREVFSFYDAREREAIGANVLFAVSGAFTIAALVPLVVALIEGEPTQLAGTPSVSFAVVVDREGGGLVLGGAF